MEINKLNVLIFLTPKKNVACLYTSFSLRQSLEKMAYHRYSAIPLLDDNGHYIGTVTEGDILYYLKDKHNLDLISAEQENILNIPRYHDNKSISINTTLGDIFKMAIDQNFIPVVDDKGVFIGIITRKRIFENIEKIKKIEH